MRAKTLRDLGGFRLRFRGSERRGCRLWVERKGEVRERGLEEVLAENEEEGMGAG